MSEEKQMVPVTEQSHQEDKRQDVSQHMIQIVQLPIITQRLKDVSSGIDLQVREASSLVCTEETVQSVKKVRANLNSQFNALEEQRKAVKKAIMGPYDEFERVYKECVTDKFRGADAALKAKISDTESGVKKRKSDELRSYFNEAAAAQHVEFLKLEDAGLNVTLSASMTSLKKNAKAFIDRVEADVSMIETQENADEIMVEFRRNGFQVSAAITAVQARHREIQRQKELAAQRAEQRRMEEEAARKLKESVPEAFSAPTAEAVPSYVSKPEAEPDASVRPRKDPNEIIPEVTFRIRNEKRSRLVMLRDWLDANGFQYE